MKSKPGKWTSIATKYSRNLKGLQSQYHILHTSNYVINPLQREEVYQTCVLTYYNSTS